MNVAIDSGGLGELIGTTPVSIRVPQHTFGHTSIFSIAIHAMFNNRWDV